jgi:hypothetical protein
MAWILSDPGGRGQPVIPFEHQSGCHRSRECSQGWKKLDDIDSRPSNFKQDNSQIDALAIFPGKWKKAHSINKGKVIDFQQGRLTISEARNLNISIPLENKSRSSKRINTQEKMDIEYMIWFDQATTPVYTAATRKRTSYANEKLQNTTVDEYFVEDYGTGAKSKLPDNN